MQPSPEDWSIEKRREKRRGDFEMTVSCKNEGLFFWERENKNQSRRVRGNERVRERERGKGIICTPFALHSLLSWVWAPISLKMPFPKQNQSRLRVCTEIKEEKEKKATSSFSQNLRKKISRERKNNRNAWNYFEEEAKICFVDHAKRPTSHYQFIVFWVQWDL